MKLASSSKPRLKRLLKTKITFKEPGAEDLRWLWAAYKMGDFDDGIIEGIDQADFAETMTELLSRYTWGSIAMAKIPGKEELVPVGLFVVEGEGRIVMPHVRWFSWAKPRVRLAGAASFLIELKKDVIGIVYAKMNEKRFFEQLCRYGIIRRVGHIHNFFDENETAVLFQTR